MRDIGPDEQRSIRPQPPPALRVAAARGRLRRCRSSEVRRPRSSRRLESAPAALATRPLPDYFTPSQLQTPGIARPQSGQAPFASRFSTVAIPTRRMSRALHPGQYVDSPGCPGTFPT